ncbi:hypothetical protein TNIN_122351 [Trichonephila inaurata madagascariensis]|uniref:Uncharacterized protein n=1 Tax=Trichonephila inaurata madagascariensis TaxID=2747483 RepID=A0A8X6XI76_9ARAC|nr:hypothetical protein TNIN_122351 [Trichonephila inaurata madagascariensis]
MSLFTRLPFSPFNLYDPPPPPSSAQPLGALEKRTLIYWDRECVMEMDGLNPYRFSKRVVLNWDRTPQTNPQFEVPPSPETRQTDLSGTNPPEFLADPIHLHIMMTQTKKQQGCRGDWT